MFVVAGAGGLGGHIVAELAAHGSRAESRWLRKCLLVMVMNSN